MMLWRIAADVIVVIHALFVAFVIFALLATVVGGLLRWGWVRNRWFRGLHLAAIGLVVLQSWLGMMCPLTTFENYLRLRGSQDPYPGDFIGYWAHRLIFFTAPPWVFTLAYTLFGAAVLATLFLVPVRWQRKRCQVDFPASPPQA